MSDDLVLGVFSCIFAALLILICYIGWRAYRPSGFLMYLGMWACIIFAAVSAVHNTLPSSAPRREATGIITYIVDHKEGKTHTYTLGFESDDKQKLTLEAAATPLFFAEKRDKVAITYLEEKRSCPRVIRFQALTGPRQGHETHVSADWLGPWIGVPLFSILEIASVFGASRHTRLVRRFSEDNLQTSFL